MTYHYTKLRLLSALPKLAAGDLVELDITISGAEMTCRVTADTVPVPSSPSGLVSMALGNGIALNWNDNAISESVTGYEVFRSTNEGGPFSSIGTPTASSYTDTTASAGVQYYYRVVAINIGGSSSYTATSGIFVVDTTPPGEVTITATTLTGATSVTVTWTKPTDVDFAGINFYRSTTIGGTYTKLNTSGLVTDDNYTDNTATAGSTWYYKVRTVDTTGNQSTGVITSKAVPASDTTPPITPGTPVALDINTAIRVTWPSNTESDLASYSIYRSDDAYATTIATSLGLTQTSYDDTSATLNTSYSYKITAIDTTGNASTKSIASNAATRTTAPATGSLDSFVRAGVMVPCVVHARGVNYSKYKDNVLTETADFPALANGTVLTAQYDWNMASGVNEPQGKYPVARAFNYAHAYDVAGTYTIKLTRTDDAGVVKVFTSKKTFTADTRRVVYCSSNGSSSTTNDGSNKASPVSMARAQAILASQDNVKVLLQRGDEFLVPGTVFTLTRANQMISTSSTFVKSGATSTAHPILTFNSSTGGYRSAITIAASATNAVVEDISFTQTWTTSNKSRLFDIGVQVNGPGNHLIRGLTFGKIGKPVAVDDATDATRYMLVQGCTCPNDDSMEYNFTFCTGADFVFLGLSTTNSIQEHILRMSGMDRICVAYCTLTNKELSTSDFVKTTTNFQQGSYCYIYKNTLTSDIGTLGSTSAGTCQIGPLNKGTASFDAFCKYCVMEENIINAMIEIEDGASYVMVRNNVITKNGSNCFQVYGHGEGTDSKGIALKGRVNHHVYLYNNTCIDNGKDGQILRVKYAFDDFEFKNNLLIGPNMVDSSGGTIPNACMYFGGLGARNVISRNIMPALDKIKLSNGTVYSTASFNTNGGISNAVEAVSVIASTGKPTFLTTTNSKLARATKGVFSSINGTPRAQADATWTPGAYQL